MFLRKNRRRVGGEVYEYWTLCESVRTECGPRQRVVATLGKLDDEDFHAGWDDIEALLAGRPPTSRTPELFDGKPGPDTKPGLWELADLSRIEVGRVREFGSVFLGLALWRRLGLHELLESLIEPSREEVASAEGLATRRKCSVENHPLIGSNPTKPKNHPAQLRNLGSHAIYQ